MYTPWRPGNKRRASLEAAIPDPRQRRLVERRFFGQGFECELDAQGRIVVPAKFRQYAGLNGEATIIGARDRFEIWNPETWEGYLSATQEEDLSDLALPF